jgi:2,3-diaminopropionate biosynthesis protein SbnA
MAQEYKHAVLSPLHIRFDSNLHQSGARKPWGGILSAVGHTPLVRLTQLFPTAQFQLYAKLEGLNPGGSIKDRTALHMLERGLWEGNITSETVIVESSSGNLAIGIAQICRYLRLRFIAVVDSNASGMNLALLKAYGAEVEMVAGSEDPLRARLERVGELLELIPGSYWPNQYSNPANPAAHYETTMAEISNQLGSPIDYLFVATSTCGTILGCAEFLRDQGATPQVIAVDAVGSAIFGGQPRRRLIPGHGSSLRAPLMDSSLISRVIAVTDLECVVGCRRLLHAEAILAGGSSGAVITAIGRLAEEIVPGANCVAVLADRGERYLDTVYSDVWVKEHFGDISESLQM